MTTRGILSKLGACPESRRWAAKHPDPKEAWEACTNAEWMIWLLGRVGVSGGYYLRAYFLLGASGSALAIRRVVPWRVVSARLRKVVRDGK